MHTCHSGSLGAHRMYLNSHCQNVPHIMQSKDSLEAHLTEHFRLSGVYWGLTALYLMDQLDIVDGAAIIDWVRSVSYGNC